MLNALAKVHLWADNAKRLPGKVHLPLMYEGLGFYLYN